MKSSEKVFEIFHQLNGIPRPSHHEGMIADWLCRFAESRGLSYARDAHDCVVIRKPATSGYEDHEPLVLLNHMDMVCVADPDRDYHPLADPIEAYVEDGWMKARGTSLGADNGIGLSMALALLDDDSIPHPALEVLTTTNEEDGMSGASNLSADFIKGRKVLNLDSEDYDTITTGAAGAYLQFFEIPYRPVSAPAGSVFFQLKVGGGLGGHSGVDIGKGRCNAGKLLCTLLDAVRQSSTLLLAHIDAGEANASIAMYAEATFAVPKGMEKQLPTLVSSAFYEVKEKYGVTDPGLFVAIDVIPACRQVIPADVSDTLLDAISSIPSGVVNPVLQGVSTDATPITSNNIGRISSAGGKIFVSTHTRSFDDGEMEKLGKSIHASFRDNAHRLSVRQSLEMFTPAWQERQDSPFLNRISESFERTLGFTPRKVEMHFVLEAGYYVRKYPGIEIACIGPRIVCPHSTKEKVELVTVENIWKVVQDILQRA